MTIETNTTGAAQTSISNGEFLTGHVLKPYIQDNKLLGAVLAFEGRSETALLHIKQMTGDKPQERLAELGVGDPLLVRIVIQQQGSRRPLVWATEHGVEHSYLVDMFTSNKEKFLGIEGRINGVTDFGVFVDLDEPCKGQRGLIRFSGPVKLGRFIEYKPGDLVLCDMAEIRVDDSAKLLIRLENARPRS